MKISCGLAYRRSGVTGQQRRRLVNEKIPDCWCHLAYNVDTQPALYTASRSAERRLRLDRREMCAFIALCNVCACQLLVFVLHFLVLNC